MDFVHKMSLNILLFDIGKYFFTFDNKKDIRYCAVTGIKLRRCEMLHLSIDDFLQTFKRLTENADIYASVFDEPVFAFFKRMHDEYAAEFSCYCFGKDEKSGFSLSDVTRRYRDEFVANSDWLKFGFHAIDGKAVYGDNNGTRVITRTVSEAAEDYKMVIGNLKDIVGESSIDRMPRIHYFAGSKECCRAWKAAKMGIKGLMAADDDRYSYYHDDVMHDKMLEAGYLYDEELGIEFYRTDIRLEKINDLRLLEDEIRSNAGRRLVVFTHEYYLEEKAMQEKIECFLVEQDIWEHRQCRCIGQEIRSLSFQSCNRY